MMQCVMDDGSSSRSLSPWPVCKLDSGCVFIDTPCRPAGVISQIFAILLFSGILALTSSVDAQELPTGRAFSVGRPFGIGELPATRFRNDLERLPPSARQRALNWLQSFHFTDRDTASLHVDEGGGIYYACDSEPDLPADSELTGPVVAEAAVPVSPFPGHLIFHSKPGAPNVLYINFGGELVTGTTWNTSLGRTQIPAVAFSTDSDFTTFSDTEQTAIKRIWERISEDYAPFDIDVTTERPASFNNRTAHALITRSTDADGSANPSSSAGGVAYVNVFNTTSYATYRPAWIYFNNLGNNESYIAEAASHEVGHNLGLSHDGTSSSSYYGGHGSGDISWGPIMGTGYNRNVSQWSKGEYYNANNTEDDLAIIVGKVTYRIDDHGSTPGTATALSITGTNIFYTTPEDDPTNSDPSNKGILERTTDVDVFSFVTGTGPVSLTVKPWVMPSGTRGGNLDVLAELYDDSGRMVLSNNAPDKTYAVIQTNLVEGRYFLHVKNSGAGSPLSSTPSGYTAYGSLGQYFIGGYLVPATSFVAPPVAQLQISDLTLPGQTGKQFTVTYSDDMAVDVSSIDGNDIRVTGPNGYDVAAQLVSVNILSDGSPRVATYSISAPSGSAWQGADNGTYSVWMQTNEVSDLDGAWTTAGKLGEFKVAVPIAIYSASMDIDPGWTLEPQWQYGTPAYPAGGPQGGFTGTKIIAYNLTGNYEDRLQARYATTPPINCSGTTALRLAFRRWLEVKSGDTATIEVSANGTTWISVWTSSGTVADPGWQSVEYPLPASVAGTPSLQVRWGMGSSPSQNMIGWNLDDVQVLGDTAPPDIEPPTAVLTVSTINVEGGTNQTLRVTYTDGTAVLRSSLDSSDLLVAGPNGYSQLAVFLAADLPSDGSPISATYSIPAPGGQWDSSDNGVYDVTLMNGAVTDIEANSTPQTSLGSFAVAISSGALAVTPGIDLNASGTVGGPFTPASINYTLTNSGASSLNWTAGKSQDWISLSPTGGTLGAGAATVVTVTINTNADALPAGEYNDTVEFVNTTAGIGNTTRQLNLTINAHGKLELILGTDISASGTQGGPFSPGSGIYSLTNSGGAAVDWIATQSASWFSLSVSNGNLMPGASTNVTLTINSDAGLLTPGDYSGTVVFQDASQPHIVPLDEPTNTMRFVNLVVLSAGMLEVESETDLSASGLPGGPFVPSTVTYSITNCGESPLDWTLSRNSDWIDLSDIAGTLGAGAGTNVTISINSNACALPAGTYVDTVRFINTTTGAGDTNRTISLLVQSTSELTVAANNSEWGSVTPTNGTYLSGSAVEIVATPAPYYQLVEWLGDAAGNENPLTVILDGSKSVQAVFGELLTTNHPTPYWWLASQGITNDFEAAVTEVGSNGMTLWQSYIAGVDPSDPASQLKLGVELSGSQTEQILRWTSVTGRVYSVWASTNFFGGFMPLDSATNLPATIQSVTNRIDPAFPQIFYRLEVLKP